MPPKISGMFIILKNCTYRSSENNGNCFFIRENFTLACTRKAAISRDDFFLGETYLQGKENTASSHLLVITLPCSKATAPIPFLSSGRLYSIQSSSESHILVGFQYVHVQLIFLVLFICLLLQGRILAKNL